MQSSIKRLDARVPQSEIEQVYDKVAGIYDYWGRLTEARARNRALELAEIQDGQHILEVAVGTGLAFTRSPGATHTGATWALTSQGMLEKAERRLERSATQLHSPGRNSVRPST
jgi:ubiquinone/menaquinone biosynthesis C-methylase UbiE